MMSGFSTSVVAAVAKPWAYGRPRSGERSYMGHGMSGSLAVVPPSCGCWRIVALSLGIVREMTVAGWDNGPIRASPSLWASLRLVVGYAARRDHDRAQTRQDHRNVSPSGQTCRGQSQSLCGAHRVVRDASVDDAH